MKQLKYKILISIIWGISLLCLFIEPGDEYALLATAIPGLILVPVFALLMDKLKVNKVFWVVLYIMFFIIAFIETMSWHKTEMSYITYLVFANNIAYLFLIASAVIGAIYTVYKKMGNKKL